MGINININKSVPVLLLMILSFCSSSSSSFSNFAAAAGTRTRRSAGDHDDDDDVPNIQVRAVSLGGWLVTEGWIKPSLFDSIPINKDFLDGTQLHFKVFKSNKYVSAELGGGSILVANRTLPSSWETFTLWRVNQTSFNLRVFNRQFVGLAGDGVAVAAVDVSPGESSTFRIETNPTYPHRVRIRAPNGFFLQVKSELTVTADYKGDGDWGDDNPSVFEVTIKNKMQGEYQVTNGYGPVLAPLVMNHHWRTFVVEDDFKFIKKSGLNAVRIPVGWWIAHDPFPPKPYVAGSLQALDRAFAWAEKYRIKVIVDLHAAPGSQNGWEHSASRDGSQEWGQHDTDIQETVGVIEFLAARYAKSLSLFAVELLNEPLAPGVSLDVLTKYYKAGYDAVRKHSATAYVVMCYRLGSSDARELFPLASGLKRSVLDVHYYNLFTSAFDALTAQQNIDYVYNNRTTQLNHITAANGPLIFIGEWVAEWNVKNATKEDYRRYGEAQLKVFGRASFGWSYWCLKNNEKHWSLEWMINNGYIKL
ncbi:probable glucan 1,3-beta-glucosidase A [Andrographis paniculata]|uniref:probable glucan 1,3-beta-glucosidase A n=1 Tax=Andrographis paniculata TaxID=175694 RepID=UPI0021E972F7|nr:probable glucan 1,3-beta-glucosidase A [Andrographis paniculata]